MGVALRYEQVLFSSGIKNFNFFQNVIYTFTIRLSLMLFVDPGGSSTLVVDGEVMNISPYNKQYEENIYSLPPEPRFVANAIMGYID